MRASVHPEMACDTCHDEPVSAGSPPPASKSAWTVTSFRPRSRVDRCTTRRPRAPVLIAMPPTRPTTNRCSSPRRAISAPAVTAMWATLSPWRAFTRSPASALRATVGTRPSMRLCSSPIPARCASTVTRIPRPREPRRFILQRPGSASTVTDLTAPRSPVFCWPLRRNSAGNATPESAVARASRWCTRRWRRVIARRAICRTPARRSFSSRGRRPLPECHESVFTAVADVDQHAPFADGDCSTCHAPHASEIANLMVAKVGDMCAECHEIETVAPAGGSVHAPAAAGDCTACHQPHGSAVAAVSPRQGTAALHELSSGDRARACGRGSALPGDRGGRLSDLPYRARDALTPI